MPVGIGTSTPSMQLTDLRELKKELDIADTDTSQDPKLNLFIESASALIEEFLGRPLAFASRTEWCSGTNTQILNLICRPVYQTPTPVVFQDDYGYYGQSSSGFQPTTQLVYGADFVLAIDQPDGTSRSGQLVRINEFWERPRVRRGGLLSPYLDHGLGNIQVQYSGGYKIDTVPTALRLACNLLVAEMRMLFPYGARISSEGYEERNISYDWPQRQRLLDLVRPLIWSYRNWRFGVG
jgi:hypothetical protein